MPAPPKKNNKQTSAELKRLKTDLVGVIDVDVPRNEDDMSIASALTENTIATRSQTAKKTRTDQVS